MKVTFVIPVFNAAPYLPRLLDSLRCQNGCEWEAVFADDASTDGSLAVLREAAAADSRLKVLALPHGGSSAARNACLDAAEGELIAFVDADDFIHPYMLSTVAPRFSGDSVDAVTFGYAPVEPGAEFRFAPVPADIAETVISDPVSWALTPWKAYAHDLWRTVYRRSAIGGLRFFPGIVHQDLLFSYEVWGACRRMLVLDVVLYAYVQSPDSVIRSPYSAAKVEANFTIMRELSAHYAADPRRLAQLRRRLFPRMVKNVWKQTEHSGDASLRALARRRIGEAFKAGLIGFGGFSLAKRIKLLRSVVPWG